MAFKMKGSPAKLGTIQGTAGHRSNVSALKKTYKEAYEGMEEKDGKRTDKYGNTYSSQKEFEAAADKWWASEAGQKKAASDKKFSHRLTKIKKSDEKTAEPKDTRTDKEKAKAAKDQKKHENKIAKMDKKYNEREENRKVQDAKRSAKYAKEYFGKGSAEHTYEKYKAAKAKGEDLAGSGGGKKAWFLGNLRRKWNQKKQDRLKGKADRLAAEKQAAEDKAIAEYNKNKKSPAKKKDDRAKLNKLVEKRSKIKKNVKERDEKNTKFLHKIKDKMADYRLKKIQEKINKNPKAQEDLERSKFKKTWNKEAKEAKGTKNGKKKTFPGVKSGETWGK